ncbi:uncharacterized protein L201_007681 [Kwoniella dendrophila CBS 6074]|uniref:Uncharacterized protein n=1 Tax=Kwoniella dendrophila CBS 6074 TaxID=1295534 RepID=A0AAX4K586_9TREE
MSIPRQGFTVSSDEQSSIVETLGFLNSTGKGASEVSAMERTLRKLCEGNVPKTEKSGVFSRFTGSKYMWPSETDFDTLRSKAPGRRNDFNTCQNVVLRAQGKDEKRYDDVFQNNSGDTIAQTNYNIGLELQRYYDERRERAQGRRNYSSGGGESSASAAARGEQETIDEVMARALEQSKWG